MLFPTIDGEEAFGITNDISVFTKSIIDAMSFAAADVSTGIWRTTTGNFLNAVDQLVRYRLPEQSINRSKPNALDATSFDFNEIEAPTSARSFVTISNLGLWGQVELECLDPAGVAPPQKKHSKNSLRENFVHSTSTKAIGVSRERYRTRLRTSETMSAGCGHQLRM